MKLKKEKIIEKYNIAFGFFIISILGMLIYNFLSLDIFHGKKKTNATKVYYADNISKAHQQVINVFNEKYKDEIEVIPINLPFTKFTTNERKELLARSLRSDNSIVDIFAVDQIWVSRFAKWAEPLDGYFSEDEINEILPELILTSVYDNKLVSIPFYLDLGVLFYRQEMLKRIPDWQNFEKRLKKSIDWDELIDISQKYFPNEYTYMFQGKGFEGLICNYVEVLSSMGGKLSFINSYDIMDSTHVLACQFLKDLIFKYKVSPFDVTKFVESGSYTYAKNENIPFFRAWFSSIKDSSSFDFDFDFFKSIKLANLPHFHGKEYKTVIGGWNLMIKKNSDKKDASLKFIKFMLSDEAQTILFQQAGLLFTTTRMYEKTELLSEFQDIDFLEIIHKHGVHRPILENYTKLSDIYSYYLNQAISGKIGSDIAMEKIANTIFSDKIFIK